MSSISDRLCGEGIGSDGRLLYPKEGHHKICGSCKTDHCRRLMKVDEC